MNPLRLSHGPADSMKERKMIGFFVGPVRYGIDIMTIREIINPGDLIEVPAVPPYVLGVADHRRAVIPIIDLRKRFGIQISGGDSRNKWILVKWDDKEVGLQVDRVTQVIKVTAAERRDRHAMLDNAEEPWIKSVYADDSGLVFELDIATVIGREAALPGPENVGGAPG
jgi:purine-binding chemotaxis protein CheW